MKVEGWIVLTLEPLTLNLQLQRTGRESFMNVGILTALALSAGVASALAGCAPRGDFTLNNLQGQQVSLSGLQSKVVLLSFWAVG